jgi:phosphatidylserine synthase
LIYRREDKDMTYRDIREKFQNRKALDLVPVDFYVMTLSPIFTKIFLKLGLTPNEVTICMILSGLIGGVLFLVPNIFIKMIGIIFIHLWYIFDCSDGEVARITRRFSKFGKEIDFTAHIVNHPIYNIAFALSLISLNRYNPLLIVFTFMLLASLDLMGRNILSFHTIFDLKIPSESGTAYSNASKGIIRRLIIAAAHFFDAYPNFALIFPITFVIDYYFATNISYYYLLINTAGLFAIISMLTFKWIRQIKDM